MANCTIDEQATSLSFLSTVEEQPGHWRSSEETSHYLPLTLFLVVEVVTQPKGLKVRPHLLHWVQLWVPQCKKDIKLLREHPKEGYKCGYGYGGQSI